MAESAISGKGLCNFVLVVSLSFLLAGCGSGGGGCGGSAVLVGIASCGGGGGDNSSSPPPVQTTTAEGVWSGPASTGNDVSLVVLENGETWGVYSNGGVIVGALYGATTSSGTTLSGTGRDFNIPARTVTPGTYSGTVASKNTITVNTSLGSVFNGVYGTAYDTAASLASVAGSFSGSAVTAATGPSTANIGISSPGVVSMTDGGCTAAGTAEPRPTGKNVFDVTVTFTGATCALGNGTVTTGVGYYDVANRQLLVMALNSAKTDGFIYLASKGADATTSTYPLQAAYKASISSGLSRNFNISGSCSGSGKRTITAATAGAVFEGAAAYSAVETMTWSYSNCTPTSNVQTTTSYYDSSYVPLGFNSVGANYGVWPTPPTIPASVKVGDTAVLGTEVLYTDSTKATGNGTIAQRYVVEADTATTAIVNLVGNMYDAKGTLTATEQDRYRLSATGTLTPISADIQYVNGTRMVFTYN